MHPIRNSLELIGRQERKAGAHALRTVYAAVSAETANAALDAFADHMGRRFPTIVKMWGQARQHVIPFYAFPPKMRRVIYTTTALESVQDQTRRVIKRRGHFPTDEACTKLIWLALRNITADWNRPGHHWRAAMNQFPILN